MIEGLTKLGKAGDIFLPALFLLLTAVGVGHASDKVFTIGVVNSVPVLIQAFDGFKAGMTELGYFEGRNVKYIYNGLLENDQDIIDAEIRNLLSKKIDLLLVTGNEAALLAKKAVEGTDMPVLVSSFHRPVEAGLIKSLLRPGGNVTGVAGLDRTPKALEWLKMIMPGLKKVYLPYNPDDPVSIICLSTLEKAASQIGVEIVPHKIHSVEEAITGIENLPKDIKAVFLIPSPTLNPRSKDLIQAAIRRRLPTGANLTLDKMVLISLATDVYDIGKQAARLAHQIHLGIKPADIPFETADVFLTINLRTAEKIGIRIPDGVLAQAKTVIR